MKHRSRWYKEWKTIIRKVFPTIKYLLDLISLWCFIVGLNDFLLWGNLYFSFPFEWFPVAGQFIFFIFIQSVWTKAGDTRHLQFNHFSSSTVYIKGFSEWINMKRLTIHTNISEHGYDDDIDEAYHRWKNECLDREETATWRSGVVFVGDKHGLFCWCWWCIRQRCKYSKTKSVSIKFISWFLFDYNPLMQAPISLKF